MLHDLASSSVFLFLVSTASGNTILPPGTLTHFSFRHLYEDYPSTNQNYTINESVAASLKFYVKGKKAGFQFGVDPPHFNFNVQPGNVAVLECEGMGTIAPCEREIGFCKVNTFRVECTLTKDVEEEKTDVLVDVYGRLGFTRGFAGAVHTFSIESLDTSVALNKEDPAEFSNECWQSSYHNRTVELLCRISVPRLSTHDREGLTMFLRVLGANELMESTQVQLESVVLINPTGDVLVAGIDYVVNREDVQLLELRLPYKEMFGVGQRDPYIATVAYKLLQEDGKSFICLAEVESGAMKGKRIVNATNVEPSVLNGYRFGNVTL